MKTVKRINTNKKNKPVYRNCQVQLMGWMHLIICTQLTVHPLVDWRDEGHSQHFSKRIVFWTWWLPILRTPHHTNMLWKKLRVYERLNQKWLDIQFLFLSRNDINSVLKILVENFCRLITPQNHPRHTRCVASWNFTCAWFVVPTCPESKSKVRLKLYMKL